MVAAHVPGIEAELHNAIKLAMKMDLPPERAFQYVIVRVGWYIYVHNRELAAIIMNSLEVEEIIVSTNILINQINPYPFSCPTKPPGLDCIKVVNYFNHG